MWQSQCMESCPVRVLLVDDHSVMRDGLRLMLGVGKIRGSRTGPGRRGGCAGLSDLFPGVVVMDVMMPNQDGVEVCREIMEFAPATRVVMLTASTEEDAVIEAVAAGAAGYLQKVSGMERLLATLRDVAAGERRVPADVVRRVFAGIRRGAEREEEPGPGELTPRDREILALFCRACPTPG